MDRLALALALQRHALVLSAVVLLGGCRVKVLPEPDFARMDRQAKYKVWEPCELFDNGRTAQLPPEGTVSEDAVTGRPGYTSGIVDGDYVKDIPLPLSVPFVELGRQRFGTFCAPCHGILGDGESIVATKMMLRAPPSLVGPVARSFAPGRIYQVITEGYGLMPRYSDELTAIEERWAVVAYLEALQMSRGVDARSLPPAIRAQAEEELK